MSGNPGFTLRRSGTVGHLNGRRDVRRSAIGCVLFALALTLLLTSPPPVRAQSGTPEGVSTGHTYTFGQVVDFTLTLPPGLEIAEATLFIRIDDSITTTNVPIAEGQGQHQRDLRERPFAPFAIITYWWQYSDAQGTPHETEKVIFLYEDNRFQWETLKDETTTLHWVVGDTAIMIQALEIVRNTTEAMWNTLEAPAPEAVTIYVYPSLPDLQSALLLAGRDWVGAQAFPEISVLLLTLPPSTEATVKMKRDLPHELAHKILYDHTGQQGYANLPAWFVEGLASTYEQSPDPAYALALQKAQQQDRLIPLETLCHPFEGEHSHVLLAYAQSQSLVQYIQRTYGWQRMRALLTNYADGLECTAGVELTLGVDLETLDRAWQAWLAQADPTAITSPSVIDTAVIITTELAPWLVLIGLLILPSIAFWISTR